MTDPTALSTVPKQIAPGGEHLNRMESPRPQRDLHPSNPTDLPNLAVPLEAIAAYERYLGEEDDALAVGDLQAVAFIRECSDTIEVYEIARLIPMPLLPGEDSASNLKSTQQQ